MTSMKATKAAENAEFIAHVIGVLAQAKSAAANAFAEFNQSALRSSDGHIQDMCGFGSVVVFKPSYRLRTALKVLGEIEPADGGAWYVSNFNEVVTSQSVTGFERANRAACDILSAAFAGEGEFFVRNPID